jgi:proteasome lid subunit RPN8/RPN11
MSDIPILRLSKELSDKIGAHGAETYPHECCGALLGRDLDAPAKGSSDATSLASREVTALFPLVNRRDDSPRNRFSVTSEDVRDAEKAAREKGIDVVGWYHSHPDHPAKPSQFDQDHAWPWYSYIIVSVANGRPETMTSWRLTDDRSQFTPENLQIAGKDAAAQSAP